MVDKLFFVVANKCTSNICHFIRISLPLLLIMMWTGHLYWILRNLEVFLSLTSNWFICFIHIYWLNQNVQTCVQKLKWHQTGHWTSPSYFSSIKLKVWKVRIAFSYIFTKISKYRVDIRLILIYPILEIRIRFYYSNVFFPIKQVFFRRKTTKYI